MTISKLIEVLHPHQDSEILIRAKEASNYEDCLYAIAGVSLELDEEGQCWRVVINQGDLK